jgi:hypothetical protein
MAQNFVEEWVSDGLVGDDEFLLGTATAAHFLSLVVPESKSLFTRLIIRLFQLVFLAEIVFFSHNKSANSIFQPAYQPNRMGPKSAETTGKWEHKIVLLFYCL